MRSLSPLILILVALGLPLNANSARKRSQLENESLCESYGETLERKFSSNPQFLIKELDELIVKVGSLGPDRVNHDKSGRMLASISMPPKDRSRRRLGVSVERSALEIRIHNKLTEANKVLTQSKRLGFFDEDEERVVGVQDACAKVIYERASILEKMSRLE